MSIPRYSPVLQNSTPTQAPDQPANPTAAPGHQPVHIQVNLPPPPQAPLTRSSFASRAPRQQCCLPAHQPRRSGFSGGSLLAGLALGAIGGSLLGSPYMSPLSMMGPRFPYMPFVSPMPMPMFDPGLAMGEMAMARYAMAGRMGFANCGPFMSPYLNARFTPFSFCGGFW